jgi:uncharacterized protein
MMANREDLLTIRAARAGQASAQLTLGKRYLFGGAGLPKNLTTALYWLDRAAQQDEQDAWLLIGRHVPFETVQQAMQPSKVCVWYERAFDAGVAEAGLVLAKLVLGQVPGAVSEAMRCKALRALQAAAHADIAEAQWLLAQLIGHRQNDVVSSWPPNAPSLDAADNEAMVEWATRAARSGVVEAQYALADHAWARGELATFLRWALPLARRIVDMHSAGRSATPYDVTLVLRCAHALVSDEKSDTGDVVRLLEFAAQAGHRDAQFSLGLWLAHVDENGKRVAGIPGLANYKRAIRWLSQAAEQGTPAAWYALSRIYLKPECSQRSPVDAQRCLEMAAHAGHANAQLELGMAAWRARRTQESSDVQAVRWLQKAMAQGLHEAGRQLRKIAATATPAAWAHSALTHMTGDMRRAYPLLAARLELAEVFGLSRTEALLIDPKAADRGHCMVVDVRDVHPRCKRRLILVQTAAERQTLNRIVAVFEGMDCGPDGPEGNYRQRLYRLKTLA